jgi:transcription initiation factor TFIIH subunit 2
MLLLDLSASMMDRNMRPTRLDLAREFITEWFDQNPLGRMGIVEMRAGMSGRYIRAGLRNSADSSHSRFE